MNLKKSLVTVAIVASTACAALAALPIFKTVSGYGNATLPAGAFIPADPNSQIRVVYVNYASDTNNAQILFSSGTTAFYQTVTNVATSSTTNQISSTNGLTVGGVLVLQHAGTCYSNSIASWNQSTNSGPYGGTNVVLNTGGWGIVAAAYDDIYLMSATTPIPTGASTNVMNGDAIYVGNYGRPVFVQYTVAFSTNRLYSVGARYDTQ